MNRFRALEILQKFTSASEYDPSLCDFLNEEEIILVNKVRMSLPGQATLMEAFLAIVNGEAPEHRVGE